MGVEEAWFIVRDSGPLLATAIHAGHDLRPEVAALTAISEEDRLREEDPFTEEWTEAAGNRVVVRRSRFEVDLNRPPERAVYRSPDEAFGLDPWRGPPPDGVVAASLRLHADFYAALRELCDDLAGQFGRFVVIDLHSYNHRRGGPDAPVDDPEANPEINVGTGSMDRRRWAPLVERFMHDMASTPFDGGHMDVRENVRFRGGYLSRWIHQTYPDRGCALAVEVKKFYMDEWTGLSDESVIANVGDAFRTAFRGILEELGHGPE